MKLLKLFPPTFEVDSIDGSNAQHNAFFVIIDKNCPEPLAVLAQEHFEWWFAFWRALPVVILLSLGLAVLGQPYWVGAFIGYCFGSAAARLIPGSARAMELRGHLEEVFVAVELYGRDFDEKLREEARVLTGYNQFEGWSVDEIEQAMRDLLPEKMPVSEISG